MRLAVSSDLKAKHMKTVTHTPLLTGLSAPTILVPEPSRVLVYGADEHLTSGTAIPGQVIALPLGNN